MKQRLLLSKKTRHSLMSLLLVMTLIITGLHLDVMSQSVYAAKRIEKENSAEKNEKQHSRKEATVVKELTDMRTKNSNTYQMSDGSRKLEIYGADIRYKENGKLKDYDASLRKTDKKDIKRIRQITEKDAETLEITADKYNSVNTSGDSKQYFPAELTKDTPVVMTKQEYAVSFGAGFINNTEITSDENTVSYEDKENNITVKYTSLNQGIKEDIILNEKPRMYEYSYTLNLEGLKYKKKKNTNSIILADKKTGKRQAVIEAPNLIDGDGNVSYEDVKYDIRDNKDGTAELTLTVDDNYFTDDRAYPVTIDPIVSWSGSGMDASLVSNVSYMQNMNQHSSYAGISVKDSADDYGPYQNTKQYAYLSTAMLELSNDPYQLKDSYIESAYLTLTSMEESSKPGTIVVKSAGGEWNPSEITWNNQPEISSRVWAEESLTGSKNEICSFDMTEWARCVTIGEIENYGLVLMQKTPKASDMFYGCREQYVDGMGVHPSLMIQYTVPEKYDAGLNVISEYNEETGKIEIGVNQTSSDEEGITDTGDTIYEYLVYMRPAENEKFSCLGEVSDTESTYLCDTDKISTSADFRIMALYSNGTAKLSDIVTYKKYTGTEQDEDGNDITTVSYEHASSDTDGDGLEDGYEIWDFKTLWNTKDSKDKYVTDSDGDKLPDGYEVFMLGTNPAVADNPNADSDGDGVSDSAEYTKGTDPWLKDSDFDNIPDSGENKENARKTSVVKGVSQTQAARAEVHKGLYDREYTETGENVTTRYITNIYSGNIKYICNNYGNEKLNKETKYFYDLQGNNTAIIEAYDDDATQTIVITYTYNDKGDVVYICDQNTRYSMYYDEEDGSMTSLYIGGSDDPEKDFLGGKGDAPVVRYGSSVLVDNKGEDGSTSNLKPGDKTDTVEDTTVYANGDKVKNVTTTYKLNDDDVSGTALKIETYYNNDAEPTYMAQYNSEGKLLKLYDYSKGKQNEVHYTYTYADGRNTFVRSDGFAKEETITEDEENSQSTTDTTYTYKDIKGGTQTFKTSAVTKTGEDSSNSVTLLNSKDTSESSYDFDNNASVFSLYSQQLEKKIYNVTQSFNNSLSASYNIDIYSNDKNIDYTYDAAGNIILIRINNQDRYKYEYDAHGRMNWQYDYLKEEAHRYVYSTTGNISADLKYKIDESTDWKADSDEESYFYYNNKEWQDQLTSYNNHPITYDKNGNPVSYIDKYTFKWEHGRQLSEITKTDDGKKIKYKYNQDGLRTYKETDTAITEYEWDGTTLIRETETDILSGRKYDIWYYYDESGSAVGYEYSYTDNNNVINTEYIYYEKDMQGNVIGLLNSEGKEIAGYTYDAWGNADGKAYSKEYEAAFNLNHITYRGYYRDDETGFYYLQNRYYDPEICRFINADDVGYLGASGTVYGYNMFTYCEDNPINNIDYTGTLSLNAALSKVNELLNKIIGKFGSYLKSLVKYNKTTKKLYISTTLIATAIDALIVMVTNLLIYRGIKAGMKLLMKNSRIRNSFINSMFNFFLNNQLGKIVLWTIVRIGFAIAGKAGAIGTTVSGIFKGYLSNILVCKSVALQKASSLISAFSSIGGITAFFLDLMDKKWDDYLTISI